MDSKLRQFLIDIGMNHLTTNLRLMKIFVVFWQWWIQRERWEPPHLPLDLILFLFQQFPSKIGYFSPIRAPLGLSFSPPSLVSRDYIDHHSIFDKRIRRIVKDKICNEKKFCQMNENIHMTFNSCLRRMVEKNLHQIDIIQFSNHWVQFLEQ